PQQEARSVRLGMEVKSVVHLARRMIVWKVELAEIVIIGLDVRAFRDREAHIREDRDEFFSDLSNGVDAPDLGRRFAHRQRDIYSLAVEARVQRGSFELTFAC